MTAHLGAREAEFNHPGRRYAGCRRRPALKQLKQKAAWSENLQKRGLGICLPASGTKPAGTGAKRRVKR